MPQYDVGNSAGESGQTAALGGGMLVDRDAWRSCGTTAVSTRGDLGGAFYFGSGTSSGITTRRTIQREHGPTTRRRHGSRARTGSSSGARSSSTGRGRLRRARLPDPTSARRAGRRTTTRRKPADRGRDYSGAAAPDIAPTRTEEATRSGSTRERLAWDDSKNASAVFDLFRTGSPPSGRQRSGPVRRLAVVSDGVGHGHPRSATASLPVRARATAPGSLGYGRTEANATGYDLP